MFKHVKKCVFVLVLAISLGTIGSSLMATPNGGPGELCHAACDVLYNIGTSGRTACHNDCSR